MQQREEVTLTREVGAIQIPDGTPIVLPEGTPVLITQQLGGSFTIMTDRGAMYRVDERNADALGKESRAETPNEAKGSLEDRVWNQLRQCYDPEIPVNIVDLGLVYNCKLEEGPQRCKGFAAADQQGIERRRGQRQPGRRDRPARRVRIGAEGTGGEQADRTPGRFRTQQDGKRQRDRAATGDQHVAGRGQDFRARQQRIARGRARASVAQQVPGHGAPFLPAPCAPDYPFPCNSSGRQATIAGGNR